jgi:hypothetical protein
VNGQLQGLEHISSQVLGILDTTADADKVIEDTGSLALVLGNTSVGHAGGNLAEGLNTTKRLSKCEDLGILAEVMRSSLATLDTEAQHTTTHTIAVLLEGNLAVGVGVDTGVVDGDNVRRSLKGESHGGGIGGSLASAQVQGLQTTVSEPAVEGGGDGADGILEERETLLESFGVESGDTHADVRVAVDILCNGVNDDVGAVVERVLHVGTHEGIIDDDKDAVAAGDVDDGTDVDEAEGWVGGGLDPDELGLVGADQVLDVQLDGRGEGDVHAVGGSDLGEVAVGAAVDIGDGDDVGAGGEGLEDVGGGCGAGGEGEGILGVLESSDGLLEVVTGRGC